MSVLTQSPSAGLALSPVVKVDGSPLPARWTAALLELRATLALRTVGRCTLRFADPGYELTGERRLAVGAQVSLSARAVPARSPLTEIFTGTVTSAGVEQRAGRSAELVAVVEDAAFRLSRTSRAQTYLDRTYADVVETLARGAGVAVRADQTSKVHPYLLQADTDLAFIDELARRIGWEWVVDRGTLRFWRSWTGSGRTGTIGPDVRLALGDTLEELAAGVSSDAPTEVTVRGWDPVKQEHITATAALDRASVPRGLADAFRVDEATPASRLWSVDSPLDGTDAAAIAESRANATGTVSAKGRCTVTPELRPGVLADVTGVGPANGRYYVQEVEHVYRPGGFHTRFTAGDRRPVHLADVARAGASSFAHAGLVIGTVTDIRDEDGLGRVKVQYSAMSDAVTSTWARVAAVGAGADRGIVLTPEVGDEVLVGFEGGDARRAVVLGGLHGKRGAVPPGVIEDGTVVNRRLTSRLGHVVELGDGRDAKGQHVLLALQDTSHRIRLGKDRADVEVPSGVPLTVRSGDSTIDMDGKGNLTLSGATITLKATQGIELSGASVEVKASAKAAVSAADVEVKGSVTAALQGGTTATIKGGMVQIN
ncbi:hypothetical protein FHE66_00500 [Georgenia sp. 311]|uniref:phage baseplate assembly protein V n=1 Tax=Georgenia sp. 311 TaxID=2585134 RepID=UPI001112B0E0|nr:phage baseplate assembly protein V [Georgenia sp. 311]TNC21048.1 hypothetical protein FHE66_00500 [Georgenia sp. 311]